MKLIFLYLIIGYYFPVVMSFVIHYSENKFFISCNFNWSQKVYRLSRPCNWSRITIDLPIISQTFILSLSLLNSARPASFTCIVPKSPYFVWKRVNPFSNEIVPHVAREICYVWQYVSEFLPCVVNHLQHHIHHHSWQRK